MYDEGDFRCLMPAGLCSLYPGEMCVRSFWSQTGGLFRVHCSVHPLHIDRLVSSSSSTDCEGRQRIASVVTAREGNDVGLDCFFRLWGGKILIIGTGTGCRPAASLMLLGKGSSRGRRTCEHAVSALDDWKGKCKFSKKKLLKKRPILNGGGCCFFID